MTGDTKAEKKTTIIPYEPAPKGKHKFALELAEVAPGGRSLSVPFKPVFPTKGKQTSIIPYQQPESETKTKSPLTERIKKYLQSEPSGYSFKEDMKQLKELGKSRLASLSKFSPYFDQIQKSSGIKQIELANLVWDYAQKKSDMDNLMKTLNTYVVQCKKAGINKTQTRNNVEGAILYLNKNPEAKIEDALKEAIKNTYVQPKTGIFSGIRDLFSYISDLLKTKEGAATSGVASKAGTYGAMPPPPRGGAEQTGGVGQQNKPKELLTGREVSGYLTGRPDEVKELKPGYGKSSNQASKIPEEENVGPDQARKISKDTKLNQAFEILKQNSRLESDYTRNKIIENYQKRGYTSDQILDAVDRRWGAPKSGYKKSK